MKNVFLAILMISSAAFSLDNDRKCVSQVFLESETIVKFKLMTCGNFDGNGDPLNQIPGQNGEWYILDANYVGATMFDKAHAQLLLSLNNKLKTYIGTTTLSNGGKLGYITVIAKP